MSKPSKEISAAVFAEIDRQNTWFLEMVCKHPHDAKAIATALLGSAIGAADTFGVDVEGFLSHLRATNPKPAPLVYTGKVPS